MGRLRALPQPKRRRRRDGVAELGPVSEQSQGCALTLTQECVAIYNRRSFKVVIPISTICFRPSRGGVLT